MNKVLLGLTLAGAAVVAPLTVDVQQAVAQPVSGGEIADFYRSRGGAPLWFSPRSGGAANQLVQLLATSQADNLNPRRYNIRALQRAVQAAQSGNPAAIQQAEVLLSSAFVAYARDQRHDPHVGVIYVDPELKPEAPSAQALLTAASRAPSLSDYVGQIGWMNPIYAHLRQAIASRLYRSEGERRILTMNLERARALPATTAGPYSSFSNSRGGEASGPGKGRPQSVGASSRAADTPGARCLNTSA